MYRVIAYHGKGRDEEIGRDLRLLWDSVRDFTEHRKLQHAYCFQMVSDGKEAGLILVLKYRDYVATKVALHSAASHAAARQSSQPHNQVDYWFYIRT